MHTAVVLVVASSDATLTVSGIHFRLPSSRHSTSNLILLTEDFKDIPVFVRRWQLGNPSNSSDTGSEEAKKGRRESSPYFEQHFPLWVWKSGESDARVRVESATRELLRRVLSMRFLKKPGFAPALICAMQKLISSKRRGMQRLK